MADRHDYVALEWVKGEIAETLKQAQHALEAFVENPQDTTRIRFCLTYIHQVHGTLQMVEFYGAALLAEEMERLAEVLQNDPVAAQSDALEVLMRAILQLPSYLDRILGARRDLPMMVLPLLNELRAVRGEKPLSEVNFFSPASPPLVPLLEPEELARRQATDWPVVVRKLRQVLQVAQVSLFRNQGVASHLNYLTKVFERLEHLCAGSPLGELWPMASALIEGLSAGVFENDSRVRVFLRRIDNELKRLLASGTAALNVPASYDLTRDLLFYLGQATSDTPRIKEIKALYKLEEALQISGQGYTGNNGSIGPDRDAMRSVVTALCEELVRIKDSLDLYVRSDRQQSSELGALLLPLKQIADTLAVLGFGQPRRVILDQIDQVSALAAGDVPSTDSALMDIAGALLYVEATLAGMIGVTDHGDDEESHLPTTDVAQVHQLVIREARNGLEQTKDAIIEFIASQWNHEHLLPIPQLLTQVRGGLGMIPLERAAGLVEACNRYIQQELLARQVVPDWQSLDTLADAITSVEYYLERLADDSNAQQELILDVAEESMETLGYPLVSSSTDVPLVVEEIATEPTPDASADTAMSDADTKVEEPAHAEAVDSLESSSPEASTASGVDGLQEDATSLEPTAEEALSHEPSTEPELPADAAAGALETSDDAQEATASLDATQPTKAEALPEHVDTVADASLPSHGEETGMDLGEVMASPVQAINPPAKEVPPSILPPPVDEEPVDEDLREVFIEEAEEVLETLNTYIPRWLTNASDREALSESRRAFHTLKGSGRMVRALIIGELSWAVENLLNRVIDHSVETSADIQHVVNEVVQLLPQLIDEYELNAQRQRNDVDYLAAAAHALARGLPIPDALESSEQVEPASEVEPGSQDENADVEAPVTAVDHAEEPEPEPELSLEADDEKSLDAQVTSEPVLEELPERENVDPLLLDIFRNEAEAHLAIIAEYLEQADPEVPQQVTDNLLRALHTLKGSAHMAGISAIADLASLLERVVKEYKASHTPFGSEEQQVLADAAYSIEDGLRQLSDDHIDIQLIDNDALLARLQDLLEQRSEQTASIDAAESNTHHNRQRLSDFLIESMDILLKADGLLEAWQATGDDAHHAAALSAEFTHFSDRAANAGLSDVEALSSVLCEVYQSCISAHIPHRDAFFEEVLASQEALVSMLNQLAVGLRATPQGERINALHLLLAELDATETETETETETKAVSADHIDPVVESSAISTAEPVAQAPAIPVDDELDSEMVAIFLEEAVDLLDSAGQALERWFKEPTNHNNLWILQRDLHTLKGGARMADIEPISLLAHELETLYEGLVDGRYQPSDDLKPLLQRCHDRLAQQLDQLQNHQALSQPDDLVDAIQAYRQGIQRTQQVEQDEDAAYSEDTSTSEVQPFEPLDEADEELIDIFLEEGFDILQSAAGSLQRWQMDTHNSFELEALQRDLHTLKGGARMADITPVSDLAHELEFLYEGLSAGRLRSSEHLFGLLHQSHDLLLEMLENVRNRQPVPSGQRLVEAIHAFRTSTDQQLEQPVSITLPPAQVEDSDEDEILEIFIEEAEDLLTNMELALHRWEEVEGSNEAVDDLLRCLHTLKGGARLAGQFALGDQAHLLEQELGDASPLNGPVASDRIVELKGKARDGLADLGARIADLREHFTAAPMPALAVAIEPEPVSEPEQPLEVLAPVMAAAPQESNDQVQVLPFVQRAQEAARKDSNRRAPQELVRVPADLLENLVNLAGETSIFRGRVEQQVSDIGATLSEMEATIERVRDQLRRLDTETQAQILSRHQDEHERAGYEEFDPLEMDRYSQLQQLSRSLFESASDLLDLKNTLASRNRDAETLLLQQARVNTELQEGLMRTRMVPFDRMVPRLRRVVRQVAGELGKQVEFEVNNPEGEMDRNVLERIVAPLEHMLRNAVDHGIENSEARKETGKPETGNIHLSLSREGGDILLTLSDDGRGIDLSAVRRKAIERGLMHEGSELSEQEVMQFILESGFSTAAQVTQISGRGVGMDVVHSEVKQLGGTMGIHSVAGEGTTFSIRLPFTVSVNRALMVHSGEDLYAVPLNTIEGIVRVSATELEAYYQAGARSFEYAGQTYELKYLGELLENGQRPKLINQPLPLPVILVRSNDHAVAIQIDSLAGSREIVVKSLGPQFTGVHGISGATILGDGRVVVILDLLALIRSRYARAVGAPADLSIAIDYAMETEVERPTLVMVVDDSVTVRKVTSRLLERSGMDVITAKDGVDAIALLQERKPDILLLDIEMPRMDGFEVASLVRHDEHLKDLPIIMITSRTGEKHRDRAFTIGVNHYLGKPYQENELLNHIQQLVKVND